MLGPRVSVSHVDEGIVSCVCLYDRSVCASFGVVAVGSSEFLNVLVQACG